MYTLVHSMVYKDTFLKNCVPLSQVISILTLAQSNPSQLYSRSSIHRYKRIYLTANLAHTPLKRLDGGRTLMLCPCSHPVDKGVLPAPGELGFLRTWPALLYEPGRSLFLLSHCCSDTRSGESSNHWLSQGIPRCHRYTEALAILNMEYTCCVSSRGLSPLSSTTQVTLCANRCWGI